MAKKWAIAIAWLAVAVLIAIRALDPQFTPRVESRPIVIPLRPSSWKPVGATHVALIAEPGALWVLLPERDGHLRQAVRIREAISQLPGQETIYARVAGIDLVILPPQARWYDLHAPSDIPEEVQLAIDFTDDHGDGTFEARLGAKTAVVPGNPTFPAKATPGALAALLADARDELAPWCVLGRDLAQVSRGHQTYQTLIGTRVANALVSLCCMSGDGSCSGEQP